MPSGVCGRHLGAGWKETAGVQGQVEVREIGSFKIGAAELCLETLNQNFQQQY